MKKQLAKLASILLIAVSSPAFAIDFDADGADDLTIYRPKDSSVNNQGVFAFASSNASFTYFRAYQWGKSTDIPVPGNFSNASGADIAYFRPSNGGWFLRKYDSTLDFENTAGYKWGKRGDNPLPCDVNGDGLEDLVFFRSSNGGWYSRLSNATDSSATFTTSSAQRWGKSTDTPVPYDFDGDGKCDYTVYRQGTWLILLSSTRNRTPALIPFGGKTDIPVPGQYTTDSIVDLAVFRANSNRNGDSLWIIRSSDDAGLTTKVYKWGNKAWYPAPGDYDKDGKTDLAVFRPSNGTWRIRTSSSNYESAVTYKFGERRDVPIGEKRAFDPK